MMLLDGTAARCMNKGFDWNPTLTRFDVAPFIAEGVAGASHGR